MLLDGACHPRAEPTPANGNNGDIQAASLAVKFRTQGPRAQHYLPSFKRMDERPALFLHKSGIKPGFYEEAVSIADIAPTVAQIIKVDMPEEVQGKVLEVTHK